VLPGAEDHHEGGVHDADVGMRESPAAGVTAGLLVVVVPVVVGEVPVRCR
jgi:hypothetical protein